MRYGPLKDNRTVLLCTVFFLLAGYGCTDEDPSPSENNGEAEDTVEPVQLMAADVLFKDIKVPSYDVPLIPQCGSDEECVNDDNPCQNRICHPTLLECVSVNVGDGEPCSLTNLCVVNSTCSGGLCVAASAADFVKCDDKDLCTMDSCDPNVGCVFSPLDSGICDDNDPCTDGDYCDDGICISGEDICPAQCGNGTCQTGKGETCSNCPVDCGPCSNGCNASEFAGCDGCGCEACVCEKKPSCCEEEWDAECGFLCTEQCGSSEDGCGAAPVAECCGCDCEECVCALEPTCCDIAWTAECVTLCATSCDGTCSQFCGDGVCKEEVEDCGSCPSDCGECDGGCSLSEGPGCEGCACEVCVCELVPSCCTDNWSSLCVTACQSECGGNCSPTPDP